MWLIFVLFVSVLSIILMTAKLKLHPFLALLVAAFGYGIFCGTLSLQQLVEAINGGFGKTVGSIGIVILAGAVIGTFLEKSGGAYRLAFFTASPPDCFYETGKCAVESVRMGSSHNDLVGHRRPLVDSNDLTPSHIDNTFWLCLKGTL